MKIRISIIVLIAGVFMGACQAVKPFESPTSPAIETPFKEQHTPTIESTQAGITMDKTTEPTAAPSPLPTETPGSSGVINVQAFPDTGSFEWRLYARNFSKPVAVVNTGDGSNRLFVIEQTGLVRIIEDGDVLSTPFIDLGNKISTKGNEQGLLGMAFHPSFSFNGKFFVNYTDRDGRTVISQFTVGEDPEIANPESEEIVLYVEQPYRNHNGGHLLFGPDGYLYIGLGDGGSGGDPEGNAQNLDTLLGKMLRIDVDTLPYNIPDDNPFQSGEGLPEIWASGLRNPWRYSFDSATGDLYIGDVGQNQWEEISYIPADSMGAPNLGWDFFEGFHIFEGQAPADTAFTDPIWEYAHSDGCSVTGGVVYRGSLESWQGIYLFGDYCSGTVWGLLESPEGIWQHQELFRTDARITAFGESEAGEVFLVGHNGNIFILAEK